MEGIIQKRNSVFDAQPSTISINITTHGSDWYWAVCAVMFASTFAFFAVMLKVPRINRIFHYITGLITLVAGVAYFTMTPNLGSTGIPVEFQRSNPVVAGFSREIFYARYIDWVVTGLIGALVKSQYKWGYHTIGCVAFLMVVYTIIGVGMPHAKVIGHDVSPLFIIISGWTVMLWTLYPISWGLCEGGNVISLYSEAVFYVVLDLLAKPVFGAILLYGHTKIDFADVPKPTERPVRDGHLPISTGGKDASTA